jgi:hypothetical protein
LLEVMAVLGDEETWKLQAVVAVNESTVAEHMVRW